MSRKIVRYAAVPGVDLPDTIHPVLRRVYAHRGVRSEADLDYSLERLLPFDGLAGMESAVTALAEALERGRRILVVADFDADGATSCALVVQVLRSLGGDVRFLVPNRFEYGYGLTPEIVRAGARLEPRLLLTVDNGITSVEGVAEARRLGMAVIITDHHLPGKVLPEADAIVNPNQAGDGFPSKALAGVGVAFYLLAALRARLREGGWLERHGVPDPRLAELLDLVALGTVADVVPLDHNNRILVAQGLARIRRGATRPGLQALAAVARRSLDRLTSADLAYALGPRLNAAGRLTDMSVGIECLLATDPPTARRLALRLDELNRERRDIEETMRRQAVEDLERLKLDPERELAPGLCLFDASWHQGVIGILASRIKDMVHRPVIAFAKVSEDELRGSARSVPGVHVRDALEAVAAREPELIVKFGGHAMAAGLSLRPERLEAFREAFAEEIARHLGTSDLGGVVHSDGPLAPEERSLEAAMAIREGGPWGQAFPEPLFDDVFRVEERRVVGERHLRLRLVPPGVGAAVANGHEAIAFRAAEHPVAAGDRVHAVYRLDANDYGGRTRLQLVVEHLLPVE